MNTIRPVYALALALCTFVTGLTAGYVGKAAQDASAGAQLTALPTTTPAPRDDPKTAYYIGVYDACMFFAVNAGGMTEQDASADCLGFVYQVSQASWYEASDE